MVKLAVISDPQIDSRKGATEQECIMLQECFGHMNADAVVVCGDITENALPEEWQYFFDTYKQYSHAENLFLIPGNMDAAECSEGKDIFFSSYERYFGKKPDSLYFVHEAEGCILIGITPDQEDDDAPLSQTQLDVLEVSIRKAAERGVPALVFSHFLLNDSIHVDWVYATLGTQSRIVRIILENYGGKVIFFSGHIHRGFIAKPGGSVLTVNNVTYVSTPSICKPDKLHYNADNDSVGTGYIVELCGVRVRIRGYDFIHQRWLAPFDWTV